MSINILRELRLSMIGNFNLSELKTLVFDLGINWDDISGEDISTCVQSVITYLRRRNRLNELTSLLRIERSQVNWPDIVPEEHGVVEQETHEHHISPENKLVTNSGRMSFEAMQNALKERNFEKARKIFQEFQKSQDQPPHLKNEAFFLWQSFIFGDVYALAQLHELAQNPETTADTYYWLAQCYYHTDDFTNAIKYFDKTLQSANEGPIVINSIISAADCLFNLGKRSEAYLKLINHIEENSSSKDNVILYESLAGLYSKASEKALQMAALEKVIECKPNDTDLLFKIAYAYNADEIGKFSDRLALLHYSKLLSYNPNDSMALNNIGVAYTSLGMPAKSVHFYRKAIDLNNTLAMANLAQIFLNSGMETEAEELLTLARRQDDVHSMVGQAIVRLSEIREKEEKTKERSLSSARECQVFILKFSNAWFETKFSEAKFNGVWYFDEVTEIELIQTGNEVTAKWTNNSDHAITGRVCNHGWQFTYARETKYSTYESIGYGYIVPEQNKIFLMELDNEGHTFHVVTRK